MTESTFVHLTGQDPLGVQAKRLLQKNYIDVWSRPVMPLYQGKASVAVAWLSRWTEGTPLKISCKLSSLGELSQRFPDLPAGLDHPGGYLATDLLTGLALGTFNPADTFTNSVNPTSILVVKWVTVIYPATPFYVPRFSILPEKTTNYVEKHEMEFEEEEEGDDWLTVTSPGGGRRGEMQEF